MITTSEFNIKHLRQTEVNDIFEVSFKDGSETTYLTFPRTMEMTCEDAVDWVELPAQVEIIHEAEEQCCCLEIVGDNNQCPVHEYLGDPE